jgi:hypothetical protein
MDGLLEMETLVVRVRETPLTCQILQLSNSCFVWVGDAKAACMSSLIVSMPTKYDSMPLSSPLLAGEGGADDFGTSMAQRIAKRFNIQCFVSFNAPPELIDDASEIEPAIFARLAQLFPKASS